MATFVIIGAHRPMNRLRRQNHWFDALYNACAAGHYCGVRLVERKRERRPPLTLEEMRRNAMSRPSARELAGQSQR